jgi:hypothetical protein
VYKGGPDGKFEFRFKAVVVDFNTDKDLLDTATEATKKGGTHLWNNKLYYWTAKKPENKLLLAWKNLTTDTYGWAIVQKSGDAWVYKANSDQGQWTSLKQGEQKKMRWITSGQTIEITLLPPRPTDSWTTNDIQYSFGYSN